ncbi:MAG TPA: hypothetical protein VLM38_08850 [Blastocatellia bacterium]|nr:hypothetical protein [Blastocatellia bacterium]
MIWERSTCGRVILGGLLAGVIIDAGEFVLNGVLLNKDFEDAMRSIGKEPIGSQAIAVFLALGFLVGITAVWIYAAIRPRFGAGAKTAICAGLVVWVLTSLYTTVGQLPIGIFPTRVLVVGTVWELVQLPLATLAGARLYKEEG